MGLLEDDLIDRGFVLHLDVAVLEIGVLLVDGVGDDNIDNLASLVKVFGHLGLGDGGGELAEENLVVMVVPAYMNLRVSYLDCLQLAELGGCIRGGLPVSGSILNSAKYLLERPLILISGVFPLR